MADMKMKETNKELSSENPIPVPSTYSAHLEGTRIVHEQIRHMELTPNPEYLLPSTSNTLRPETPLENLPYVDPDCPYIGATPDGRVRDNMIVKVKCPVAAFKLGIGRGIAIELWRAGAQVVAVSRTKSHLDSLKQEYPSIDIVSVDLADWNETRRVIDSLGLFDGLVNNAALGLTEDFLTTTPKNFDLLMNVNVKSVLNVSQVVAKKMVAAKNGGAIVNMSSQASKAALWGHVTYGATKGAIDSMTQVMAMELGPHNIRVNAVNPTVIMTEMGREGWSDPDKAEKMLSKIPLGRFGEVSEVVNAVLFLLSDKASMINGVHLPIDGGFLAC